QQILYVMRKTDGELVSEALQPTLFVPMTGAAEQQREIQPDPDNPQIVNGNFEEPAPSEKFIPGWYYQRLGRVIKADAAEGQQFVRFQNDIAGQGAFMLQGLPIRGQQVTALKLSASVRLENVRDAGNPAEYATIAVTFYDTNRRDLGVHTIGRLRGTHDW